MGRVIGGGWIHTETGRLGPPPLGDWVEVTDLDVGGCRFAGLTPCDEGSAIMYGEGGMRGTVSRCLIHAFAQGFPGRARPMGGIDAIGVEGGEVFDPSEVGPLKGI